VKKFYVEIEQNGGEYYGWVTFFAEKVEKTQDENVLLVDGRKMTFEEKVMVMGND